MYPCAVQRIELTWEIFMTSIMLKLAPMKYNLINPGNVLVKKKKDWKRARLSYSSLQFFKKQRFLFYISSFHPENFLVGSNYCDAIS